MAETKADIEAERDELRTKLAALEAEGSSTAAPKGPHVITGVKNVLANLAVKKGGQLPSNMGGKPYISAVDLNYEVKMLFVANDLILVPKEHMLEYHLVDSGNRKNIHMVIEGTYTIISDVDSSQITIAGIGDGIAAGSAVASNIASTNALKNALLRTFMVTEQSAEDAAKEGPGDAPTGDRAQQAAQSGGVKPPVRQVAPAQVAVQPESDLKTKIRVEFLESVNGEDPLYTKDEVNGVMDIVKGLEEFRGADKMLPEVYRRLKNGELS